MQDRDDASLQRCAPDVTNIEIEIAQDCFNQHIGPSDRRRFSRGVPFQDKASQCMLKPTWRSEQKREEQAEAEAAIATTAEEPDFDTRQSHEEQGSDLSDEDIDRVRADEDSPIAEPESKPEHRDAKSKEGADNKNGDEDSTDDAALPAKRMRCRCCRKCRGLRSLNTGRNGRVSWRNIRSQWKDNIPLRILCLRRFTSFGTIAHTYPSMS